MATSPQNTDNQATPAAAPALTYPTMDPGFAGMKADAGDDRVESFPVGQAALGLGLVCGTDASGALTAPGAGTKVRGITLHSHVCAGTLYVQYDCASVMTRGLVWARVKAGGAITKDGPVKFDPDGTVSDGGATALANAVFRSDKTTTLDGDIVVVELHNPFMPAAPVV